MNNPERNVASKDRIKTFKGNLPDTTKTLSAIIGNLDSEDNELAGQSKSDSDTVLPSAFDNEVSTMSDANVAHSLQANSVGTSSDENLEGIVPNELNMISDIQQDLKADDQEAVSYHGNTSLPLHSKYRKGTFYDISKSTENEDSAFPNNNPFVADSDTTTNAYKKDLTTDVIVQKNQEANQLIDRVNKQDDKLKLFASSDKLGLDTANYDDSNRAKNIVSFAAQEDAEILVGGSRIHKNKASKKKHKKIKNKRRPSAFRISVKDFDIIQNEDRKNSKKESVSDTGFFMADERDIADLNKKTEDFVSHTVNASLFKVIIPDRDAVNKTVKYILEHIAPVENTTEDEQVITQSEDSLLNETTDHDVSKKDREDNNLFEKLNKTEYKRLSSAHKLASVWKLTGDPTPSKVIKISGKPGVQIDLYITNNEKSKKSKKKKKKKLKVRKAHQRNSQGVKRYISSSDQDDLADVEDVSINEVVANQEKQMFSDKVAGNSNEFGSDKTSIADIQTNHVEGSTLLLNIQSTLDISSTRYLELCPNSNKTLGHFSINSSGVTIRYLELSISRTFSRSLECSTYREVTVRSSLEQTRRHITENTSFPLTR